MKIKKLIVISSIFIISFYLLFSNLEFRTKLSSQLAIPNYEFIEQNNIKTVQIELTKSEINDFKKLFRDYKKDGLGNENKNFLKYYSLNNKWIKSKLRIDGIPFQIKLKSHGRTPYAHKYGSHVSLSIKFKDKPYPFYGKRVNLIIYNRIQLDAELVELLANKFNLIRPKFELVNANIGNNDNYYYFVEERIDNYFFESRKLPMIIFNKKVDGSLIYNGTIELLKLQETIQQLLTKKDNFTLITKEQILNDYIDFNQSIFDKNIKKLESFFNMEYMVKLNAFRVIFGSNGHGFNNVNLEMAYNYEERKFYPIVHRDMRKTTLKKINDSFNFMDNTQFVIPFWIILDSDPQFITKTFDEIKKFQQTNKTITIKEEILYLRSHYKKAFNYEFSSNNNGQNGQNILNNLNSLNNDKLDH